MYSLTEIKFGYFANIIFHAIGAKTGTLTEQI